MQHFEPMCLKFMNRELGFRWFQIESANASGVLSSSLSQTSAQMPDALHCQCSVCIFFLHSLCIESEGRAQLCGFMPYIFVFCAQSRFSVHRLIWGVRDGRQEDQGSEGRGARVQDCLPAVN